MKTEFLKSFGLGARLAPAAGRLAGLSRAGALRLLALACVVGLAAVLRFADLQALGYANHYYTAAVQSMLQSWRNFFFVAAEPGGAVSVDKPPLGLWLQAASAAVFGVNGFGVLLPQLVAGTLSVVVLYHLVRRRFGTAAGLIAALSLAVTPVVVATDRNNTMDSTLILTLLLAAWAFIKATETARLRYLWLGAALVGFGFNIKMLQAYLPLPAFYAMYFLGAARPIRRKLVELAGATLLLLAVSLSWAAVVELTPADQRPYVGSSGNNSVISLIVGYNGMERLLGMGGDGSTGAFASRNPRAPGGANGGPPGQGGFPPGGPGGRGAPGGGFPGTGRAGLTRLFVPPLSKEASWLLVFGLFATGLLALRARPAWPISRQHQAAVVWGGWLLVAAAFFSVAGFFHEYYLSMLAPPAAALTGIGLAELWRLRRSRPWRAAVLLLLAAAGALAVQLSAAVAYVGTAWWLAPALALFAAGALALFAGARRPSTQAQRAGFAAVAAAILLIPGIWSGLTSLNAAENQSLPSAYSGTASRPANQGSAQVNQVLLDYLQARTQDTTYLMAVPSAMQGADYVIATGRPVLYLGGFMGQDQVKTAGDLARMVADRQLRFIYWDARGGGFGGNSDVSAWIASSCAPVQGYDTATQNSGTPDGTRAGGNASSPAFNRGNLQVTLYDCRKS